MRTSSIFITSAQPQSSTYTLHTHPQRTIRTTPTTHTHSLPSHPPHPHQLTPIPLTHPAPPHPPPSTTTFTFTTPPIAKFKVPPTSCAAPPPPPTTPHQRTYSTTTTSNSTPTPSTPLPATNSSYTTTPSHPQPNHITKHQKKLQSLSDSYPAYCTIRHRHILSARGGRRVHRHQVKGGSLIPILVTRDILPGFEAAGAVRPSVIASRRTPIPRSR